MEKQTSSNAFPRGHSAGGQLGRFGTHNKLPAGAVVLTDADVMDMQMKMIQKWEPRSDIWPFTYGNGIQGGLAVLTGVSGNFHYRRVLRLLHHGRASTYAPAVILPACSAMVLHHVFISQPILLGRFSCPSCAEIRAASMQVFTGFIIPWTISILGCLALAKTKHTVPVPHILNIKAFSEFLWKKTRIANVNMMGLLAVNITGAICITNQEMRYAPKIWKKMGFEDAPEAAQATEKDDW